MSSREKSAERKIPVNRIIPFSSVDGPGNRTAVFLQGCNWDCQYCHNPETRNMCVGCGDCVDTCPAGALKAVREEGGLRIAYDPEKCIFCDACIKRCGFGSSPRIQMLSPEQIFSRVKAQVPFIRGVTVSGGECCLHMDALKDLFILCRNAGLDTMIDTNGSIPFAGHDELLEATDGVMLDVKAFDPEEHRTVTAAGNNAVLENAVYLAERGKLFEVRTVVVPGLFSLQDTVRSTCRLLVPFLRKAPIRYKLIAYRENGVRTKYRRYKPPGTDIMEQLREIAEEEGFTNIVCT